MRVFDQDRDVQIVHVFGIGPGATIVAFIPLTGIDDLGLNIQVANRQGEFKVRTDIEVGQNAVAIPVEAVADGDGREVEATFDADLELSLALRICRGKGDTCEKN